MSDIDKDTIEGGIDKAKGTVKEQVGELRGDDMQVAEGQRDQAVGGIKRMLADAKDKISELIRSRK